MVRCLSRGVLMLALAWSVATQVFAWQHGYHPVLGRPLFRLGQHQVYPPTAYPRWLWRWGWSRPGAFQSSGSVVLMVLILGGLGGVRRTAERPRNAAWAPPQAIRQITRRCRPGRVRMTLLSQLGRNLAPGCSVVVASPSSGTPTSLGESTLLDWHPSVSIVDP